MLKPVCKVEQDHEIAESDEFIAFLAKPDGDISLYYKTDALTMGMAMQMCIREFAMLMEQVPEEEQREIQAVLGGHAEELSDENVQVETEIFDDMEDADYD